MRRILTILLLTTAPAFADDLDTSAMVGKQGLTATIGELEATEASPDRDMALAGLRFLSGVEQAYQARWKSGATAPLLPFPVLGADLPLNPDPKPLSPDFINTLAQDLSTTMTSAREAIPDEDGAVVLRMSDLWLDVNMDEKRGPDEDLLTLAGLDFPDPQPEGVGEEIRFDASDAHWLRAYTHLIQAFCSAILAFDPEPELARSIELNDALYQQMAKNLDSNAESYSDFNMMAQQFGPMIDKIAILLQTLRHEPDKAKVDETIDHLHAMIAANREFWKSVALETDNDREWIPNDKQQAALGFQPPKGAGEAWLRVLFDAEEVLTGEKLIPYWRFSPGYGVDLAAWLDDPQPVDVLDWIQGTAALPYAKEGEIMSREGWNQFTQIFGSRAGLYMVLFN